MLLPKPQKWRKKAAKDSIREGVKWVLASERVVGIRKEGSVRIQPKNANS